MPAAPFTRFDLTGKTVVVTGGSRGVGFHAAVGLSEAGAEVVVVSRKQDACDAAAAAISEQTGRTTHAMACHVGHWDAIDEFVARLDARVPRVDVLLNNAGIAPTYPSIELVSEELWDKVLGVNLKGPFRLAALLGSRMAAADGGSIINISSGAAVRPDPSTVPYAAAKAGLNAITLGLAHALGPSVRVNCIMLGRVLTDIAKGWDMEIANAEAARYGVQRIAEPREIVESILYLASDASSYTTGAIIPVDGGFAAG